MRGLQRENYFCNSEADRHQAIYLFLVNDLFLIVCFICQVSKQNKQKLIKAPEDFPPR